MASQCSQGVNASSANAITIQRFAIQRQVYAKIVETTHLVISARDAEMAGTVMPFYAHAKVERFYVFIHTFTT